MDYFNPDKVRLGRYLDFDSLQAYGIGDMFSSTRLFVFLKEKFSWYPDLVGKFYANMQ